MNKSKTFNGMLKIFLCVAVIALITVFFTGNLGGEIKDKAKDDPVLPPAISVNRTNLNFGSIREGHSTSSATSTQTLLIDNSGGGHLDWTIHNNGDWLICTPNSGLGSGTVSVSVAPCGLPAGAYSGSLTISDADPSVSPQTVTVDLTVKNPAQDMPPFGSFDTPLHHSTVRSSIPVTGWVLDDVEVDNVKIFNGDSYVGDATFVEGARSDVETLNPDSPNNYKAGWGYMMLTNFLPNGGNGTYTFYAIATDSEGNKTTLGSKTVLCDNAHAVKPFGAIDTPAQGAMASGSDYINWGWALTPQPKHIPTDGSTINVWVDGVGRGHPTYNSPRSDVAALFPDYENSQGAGGFFELDTTGYADGVYTICWTASDNEGATDGIGSRYFTIRNTGNGPQHSKDRASHQHSRLSRKLLSRIPVDYSQPLRVKKGYNKNIEPQNLFPGEKGIINIQIKELQRVVIHLAEHGVPSDWQGFQVTGEQLRALPIGSTMDMAKGIFYWQPGPAFLGTYRFVFIEKNRGGQMKRKNVIVKISPKFE